MRVSVPAAGFVPVPPGYSIFWIFIAPPLGHAVIQSVPMQYFGEVTLGSVPPSAWRSCEATEFCPMRSVAVMELVFVCPMLPTLIGAGVVSIGGTPVGGAQAA